MQSGWALGWGAAAILYTVVFSRLPEQTAWRVLFLAGIAPALLVLYIRRYVEEPEVYRAARASAAKRANFYEIFAPEIIRTTALGALLATGAQGGYYAVTTWLPTYLKTVRGLSVFGTGSYLLGLDALIAIDREARQSRLSTQARRRTRGSRR